MCLKGLIFFMKKLLLVIITIIIMLVLYVNVNADEIVIPSSAIRFRVVANSNSIEDQSMKIKVRDYINEYLSVKMVDISDVEDANRVISDEINNINNGIEELFEINNYNKDFSVYFGDTFFPKKIYKGINYEGGNYESLVIVIGNGKGDNWWCVLFPPLCLLDASESDIDDVEYQFFIKNLIKDIFE